VKFSESQNKVALKKKVTNYLLVGHVIGLYIFINFAYYKFFKTHT